MKIIVTGIKSPVHRGVIEHLAQDAGFGESAVEWSSSGATIYVGTVQARSDAGIPESELYGLVGKIVILGATVQRDLNPLEVNVNNMTREELSGVYNANQPPSKIHIQLDGDPVKHTPGRPFIYNRFGKVE